MHNYARNLIKKIILCVTVLMFGTTFGFQLSDKLIKTKTNDGAPVLIYPSNDVKMVLVRIAFRSGAIYDGEKPGLSQLTLDMMDEGTATLSATQFAKQLAETGAQIGSDNNKEMSIFTLKTLSEEESFNKATRLFTEMLSHPNFQEADLSRIKKQQIASIKQMLESPDEVANKRFMNMLFNNHPIGQPSIGTSKTIPKITLQNVKDFYNTYYNRHNITVVIIGDITSEKAIKLANSITNTLPNGKIVPLIVPPNSPKVQPQTHIRFTSTQSSIRMGQLGISYSNPDYFPLLVGNYILGGGTMVSRLALDIREKKGLTYGVYSQFIPLSNTGIFLIALSTKNNSREEAILAAKQLFADFLNKGPSDKELIDAKKYLIGSFPLSMANFDQIASLLLRQSFYDLPNDYLDNYTLNVNKVTKESITHAFQSLFKDKPLLILSVGQ